MNEMQKKRFNQALARMSGDEDTLVMLASIVVEDAPTILKRLNEELQAEDLVAYAKTGHALKGLLSTFETDEPVSQIQSLIDDARKNDLNAVRLAHEPLMPEFDRLLTEVAAIA
jgi:HPt (histidine-containing phosphotransfer) domain-containing protein